MQVTISPRALDQLSELVQWWREHRPDAADLVNDEFERALEVLSAQPHLGPRYPEDPRYRLHRLKGTPYRLFYVVDEEAKRVEIDAV